MAETTAVSIACIYRITRFCAAAAVVPAFPTNIVRANALCILPERTRDYYREYNEELETFEDYYGPTTSGTIIA
ncbi:hypothetical protein RB195_016139 [Necator americanus]|uniref:Secreted protein n=1 Tax=Necator americanus TaxID=51031 RepID=A0ABR1E7R8_NECAM